MAYDDLRIFLDALETAGQLARVPVEVDPMFEVGAVCRQALATNGPGLLFERVKGSPHRLATNLLATRERLAIALGVEPREIASFWNERAGQTVPPRLRTDGACQELVLQGADVDLSRFAVPTWNEEDGGPYITFPCYVSRNPTTGGLDCGMYRTQVFDDRTVALNARPAKGINVNRSASALGDDGFPVAIVLGLDPVIHMTTVANLPYGVGELGAAGALRGAPVELVRCVSQPLEVPASAEIVLEGVVTAETRKEGPFGEYHGYYGAGGMRSVIRLTAITCRADAINQQVYEGRPPQEDAVMHGTVVACEILRRIDLEGVQAVNVTPHSGGHLHCVISVDSRLAEDGLAVGRAVLAVRGVKLVTVVDADVDVFDAGEVEWAVATRVDYSRDVEIINAQADPGVTNGEPLRELLRGSKMIVDATRPTARGFPREARPPDSVVESVRRNWATYQISGSWE